MSPETLSPLKAQRPVKRSVLPARFEAEEIPEAPLPKEKSRFGTSFVIAAGLHVAALFLGSFALVQPPEYGIEGSQASMYVYMVAARPDQAKPKKVLEPTETDMLSKIPEMESDMMLPGMTAEQKKAEALRKKKEEDEKSARAKEKKAKAAGDGSSETPGESVTTLYSPGSSEIAGKAGKYRNRPPQYPAAAERNGWEGEVMLKARIVSEGHPAEVVIEKSSGYSILDQAALKAVRKWKFTAGRIGGIEVATWVRIPVKFEIDKTQSH